MFKFTRFSQQDPRWVNQQMGFDPQATIGGLGCLLTDLAMVTTGFGYEETPASLNQKLKALGPNVGFIEEKVVPAALPRILPGFIFRDFMFCRDIPAPMPRIDAALAAGWPVIVEVDYAPAAGLQNHWVLLCDKKEDEYYLQDPWPYPPGLKPIQLSTSRYIFAGPPEKIITAVVWLEGPRPPVNKPDSAISVFATADGLAIRSQPVIDPLNLLKRVPLLSELYALEPVEAVLQKVGLANHWLNVQDPDGTQGFAAAWYLNTRREVPAGPVAAPPPGAPLKVFATVDQLALRSQPVVAPETLLKRLAGATELLVLDPPAEAAPKIGLVDAWVRVKDPAGDEGFVAAWYLSVTPTAGFGPGAISPVGGTPSALYVRTKLSDVALRTQPVVSPKTWIKWLPAGADLLVIEPPQGALAKIGVKDQWLNVRDLSGTAGFIAAWYVK